MVYGVSTTRNQDTQKKIVSNFMEKNKFSADWEVLKELPMAGLISLIKITLSQGKLPHWILISKKRLKGLLDTLSKSSSSCLFAQNGKCLISSSFNASRTSLPNCWVLDSNATNCMTHESISFISYKPSSGHHKITIVNGYSLTVASKGKGLVV